MLCVLGIRSTGLPMSWGDAYDSICLTVWVTHDPSTAVRATTSLGGERAHQRCLFSPLPTVFSRALFSTTHPTLVENGRAEPFPRFHEINFIPLRFVQHCGNVQPTGGCHRGMGKKESGGLGEKTQKGKGDRSRAAPPSPGLSPQDSGKTVLRGWSTQSIKDKSGKSGHEKYTENKSTAQIVRCLPYALERNSCASVPAWKSETAS